jgi:hypothetical protein
MRPTAANHRARLLISITSASALRPLHFFIFGAVVRFARNATGGFTLFSPYRRRAVDSMAVVLEQDMNLACELFLHLSSKGALW